MKPFILFRMPHASHRRTNIQSVVLSESPLNELFASHRPKRGADKVRRESRCLRWTKRSRVDLRTLGTSDMCSESPHCKLRHSREQAHRHWAGECSERSCGICLRVKQSRGARIVVWSRAPLAIRYRKYGHRGYVKNFAIHSARNAQ